MIGIGVVGIPLGFYRAGWALGLIVLLCITSVSYMTMIWILEVRVVARPAHPPFVPMRPPAVRPLAPSPTRVFTLTRPPSLAPGRPPAFRCVTP